MSEKRMSAAATLTKYYNIKDQINEYQRKTQSKQSKLLWLVQDYIIDSFKFGNIVNVYTSLKSNPTSEDDYQPSITLHSTEEFNKYVDKYNLFRVSNSSIYIFNPACNTIVLDRSGSGTSIKLMRLIITTN